MYSITIEYLSKFNIKPTTDAQERSETNNDDVQNKNIVRSNTPPPAPQQQPDIKETMNVKLSSTFHVSSII